MYFGECGYGKVTLIRRRGRSSKRLEAIAGTRGERGPLHKTQGRYSTSQ